jgi:metallo-beta-lactamase family protein
MINQDVNTNLNQTEKQEIQTKNSGFMLPSVVNPEANSFYVAPFGAARTVTGSLYYLEYFDANLKPFRFTIDAGMFQVGKKINLYRINSNLGFDPSKLDTIVLTHAHLDHCGRVPYLVKMGFEGPIYCTPATSEIATVVMLDSAKMQEEGEIEEQKKIPLPEEYTEVTDLQKQALQSKKDGKGELEQIGAIADAMSQSKGHLKLYSIADAQKATTMFKTFGYHKKFKIHPDLELEYCDAGHILGSAYVLIRNLVTGKEVVFSGDLGNVDKPIIENPEIGPKMSNLTNVFTETTYGDKQHGKKEPKLKLLEACKETLERGHTVFIPAFSVERAQEIIYFLYELMEEQSLPYCPVFLDSPMASAVVDICNAHQELYDEAMEQKIANNQSPFDWTNLVITRTRDESKQLNANKGAQIVIAGSGMLTGGRIMHHVKHNVENPDHMLVFCGYQAEGTLGREILDGATEVEIMDEVKQVRIQTSIIREFSAHADQLTLLAWLDGIYQNPKVAEKQPTLFLMHGEKAAVEGYQTLVNQTFPDIKTYWPKFAERIRMW